MAGKTLGLFTVRPVEELWAKYTLVEKIGEGGYGTVWLCEETATGALYAVKIVSKASAIASAKHEVRQLSLVLGHENIVTLHEVYEGTSGFFMLMEYCEEGDLLGRINKQGNGLTEDDAREIFRQLVTAVRHCHSKSLLHRDIKPDNILLTHTACEGSTKLTVKLADFGLAAFRQPGYKIRGYAGSFPYEAPEVIAKELYDESADVFSLGVVLYAMLSAMWPCFYGGKRQLDPAVDWSDACWREASSSVRSLITRMMSVDPQARPSLEEVLTDRWVAPHVQRTPSQELKWFKAAQAWIGEALSKAALSKAGGFKCGVEASSDVEITEEYLQQSLSKDDKFEVSKKRWEPAAMAPAAAVR